MNVNPINIHVNLFHMESKRVALGYAAAPGLTVLGFIMAADLVFCMLGLIVDRRVITGAPAWLKPAKFALSTMIACWSFAFCMALTTIWPGVRRVLDVVLTSGLFIEIALIDMQAARGTSSHFNLGTRFDAAVFGVMGVSIVCIWLGMLVLTVVLFRQSFTGSAWGWSLRLGMVLALVGTGSGALMTVPNSGQLARTRWALRMEAVDCPSPAGAPITVICGSPTFWACMVCRFCRCWRGGSHGAGRQLTRGHSVILFLRQPQATWHFLD
jgi:hypothetical protein